MRMAKSSKIKMAETKVRRTVKKMNKDETHLQPLLSISIKKT